MMDYITVKKYRKGTAGIANCIHNRLKQITQNWGSEDVYPGEISHFQLRA